MEQENNQTLAPGQSWETVWAQAEQARGDYPDLDLVGELRNPSFGRLLAAGVPVRAAFEVIHRDEILQGAMEYAARQTSQKLANALAAGAQRPQESGLTGAGGALHTADPRHFTASQRAAYRRRVMLGEKVVF